MCHDCKSPIFLIKCDYLGCFVYLNLRKAALWIEKVRDCLHKWPTRFLVFSSSLFLLIFCTEAISLRFNTLFDWLVDFEDVYTRPSACTSYHVQTWVENYLSNGSFSTSSFQLLQRFTAICTEYLDYTAILVWTCNQSSIWIYSDDSKFSVMSLNRHF